MALVSPIGLSGAQVRPDTTSTESVERILESLDEDAGEASVLIDFLAALRQSPVDINSASVSELSQIPSIDELLAFAIVAFRDANGNFSSLTEVQLVDGITDDAFIDARPYLTIGSVPISEDNRTRKYPHPIGFREILTDMRFDVIQRVTRRVELGSGYDVDSTRTAYSGSPERVYTRIRGRIGRRVSLNFTGEKDPGERFQWEPAQRSYGYDHVTIHLAIRDFGRLQTLVFGDYTISFGQGLVFWKGMSAGKGRDVIAPATRSGNGVVPYGSTDENKFLRGVAATARITPELSVTGFLSRRTLDATLVESVTTGGSDPDVGNKFIEESSLTNTGLHRTPSEMAKRDALRETVVGGDIEFVGKLVRFGSIAYSGHFDKSLIPGTAAYERYRFSGSNLGIAGLYGSVFLGSYALFGEIARDQDGNVAAVGGTSLRIGRVARAVVSARRYPRSFSNIHGHSFGEGNGSTQNESGLYVGLQLRPARGWKLSGYFDQYRFPWLRFGVPRPSNGHESLFAVEHKPTPWLVAYVQLRTETTERGFQFSDILSRLIDGVRDETRQSVRLNLRYEFTEQLTLRSRVEATRFENDGESATFGTMLLQDVRWRATASWMFDTRTMVFDTDGFDSRVFVYEYDLRYTFSVPSFSGRGQRTYLMATFTPDDSIDLQLKYGVTRFEHVTTVGTGLDQFEGDRLREIRVQLQWRF